MSALSPVVGHERAREILRRALAARTVGAGYLFSGPAGVGKRLVAEEFVRAFLCREEGPEPCGVCPSCTRGANAPHPDALTLGPAEKRKSIVVEQVRELTAALALSPAWGHRRAAIIDPADAMNANAANALLKTLEEPPAGRTIVLVASRPGSLPATVLSRCRRVPFGVLTEEEVATVLMRAARWPEQTARQAAALAEGSPGAALARDGKAWQEAALTARSLLGALVAGDRGAQLALAESAREGREGTSLALQVLLGWLRQAARGGLGLAAGAVPEELRGRGTGAVSPWIEGVLEALRRLEANANPKLVLATLGPGGGETGMYGRPGRPVG